MRSTIVCLILTACLLTAPVAAQQSSSLRALILTGKNDHDWVPTTPILKQILVNSGRFEVRINEEPSGITSRTLAGFDVLILHYNGPRWGVETEKAVTEFVRSGKGMVAIHGVSYAFGGQIIRGPGHALTGVTEQPWSEYSEMLGATWTEENLKRGHGKRHIFPVRFTDWDHPIAKGLGETLIANDELYHNMTILPNAKVIGVAWDDPDLGGTGRDEPVLWTVNYGSGRVFHTTMGHDGSAMNEPGFMSVLARGAEWAATGKVTVPPQTGSPKFSKDAVRVQVVTGGHDHENSFYSLFEGYNDLVVNVNPHPNAYNHDLRKSKDVLVLYDLINDVPEAQKTNLRNFLESGKGLVVLHHAVADFNSWPWWYEEVVNGKYLLKPEGDKPASLYKHDEEEMVEMVGQHPITTGIGPLHIWDETYKQMWISPKVTVLLKTDNPTSDGPVAWISPYAKSRVVVIQLGHDVMAYQHPAYRRLVRNAILWAAGRLK